MADDLTVVCPKCHASGHVPLGYAGKDIHCKKCGVHFYVPAARPAAAPVTPPSAADFSPMGAVANARHATATSQTPPAPAPAPVPAPAPAPDDDDGIGLAPLTPEEEVHCRERYEARVLSKDRSELNHDPDIERERERAARRGMF